MLLQKFVSDEFVGSEPRPTASPNVCSFSEHCSNPRVVYNPQTNPWIDELSNVIQNYMRLQRGWDGYEGKPIPLNTAVFTIRMMEHIYRKGVPTPSLVPGGDGSLQLEWHHNGFDVELHVLRPCEVNASYFEIETEIEEEFEISTDFTSIIKWFDDLVIEGS